MRLKHLLVCVLFHCAICANAGEKVEIFTPEYAGDELSALSAIQDVDPSEKPHKSISELVNEQTEAIKKIISDHKPPPSEHEPDSISKLKIPDTTNKNENEDSEELQKKCQELSKVMQWQYENQQKLPTSDRIQLLPELIRFKPKFPTPPPIHSQKPPQMAGNYFIFTQNPHMYGHRTNKFSDKMYAQASSLEEEQLSLSELQQSEESSTEPIMTTMEVTTKEPPLKIKYVRLDQITLQNTHLSNGQTVLSWFRILPTTQSFIQIANIPENEEIFAVAQPPMFDALKTPLPRQYKLYIDPLSGHILHNPAFGQDFEGPIRPTAQHIQTRPQFFINPHTGMIYQSGLPQHFNHHKRPEHVGRIPTKETSTESPTTTTTTTTATAPVLLPDFTIDINEETEKPAEKKYQHEFRFVVPMVMSGTQEKVSNYPFQFDPYAYYPKGQQPELMNVPLPYVPNYHMIHTLGVPNKFD